MTHGHKITRLRILNYRGVRALDEKIGPAGAIFRGKNGGGKTSILRAIRAALAAQDIKADAITIGEERAEILIDIDDVSAQRVITQKTTDVKVSRGGMFASKPQTFLNELLGNAALDPLDLFLEKKDRRRAIVLEALPVRVTREQLRVFAPVGDDVDVSGHGLEVLERLRKHYYDLRTSANKTSDEAKREHSRLTALVLPTIDDAPTVAVAEKTLADAQREASRLADQEESANALEKRQAAARRSVADMRLAAGQLRVDATTIGRSDEAVVRAKADVLKLEIDELRKTLLGKQRDHAALVAELDQCIDANAQASALRGSADAKEQGATEIEATLNATAAYVTPEQIADIESRVTKAREDVTLANTAAARIELRRQADAAGAKHHEAQKAADELDAIVKRLTHDAPLALAKSSDAIPGLVLEGDRLLIDGVDIDKVSGAEQMRFAVTVAKRLNAKSKILVVDGLERLDPENIDRFLAMATEDAWQVIATKVDRGDVVIEAIEIDKPSEAQGAR